VNEHDDRVAVTLDVRSRPDTGTDREFATVTVRLAGVAATPGCLFEFQPA
jgi:hypothetical protein